MLRVSIIQKNKSKGVKTWYARIADPEEGIEAYRSLHTTLKGEAQYLAAQALEDFKHKGVSTNCALFCILSRKPFIYQRFNQISPTKYNYTQYSQN